MPCDTPPPPSAVEDIIHDDEEIDDSTYDFFDDIEEVNYDSDTEDGDDEDDSILTFDGHKGSVFCCNVDRTGKYVVTGGQDDTAFVWSVLNKAIKFECTGHSDSVILAGFSSDSKYVSTADMNGLIQVWDMEYGSVAWDFETSEVTWTGWLREENTLLACTVDGSSWKWSIPDGTTTMLGQTSMPCSAACISHNDKLLAVGYEDGSLKFWDIPTGVLLSTIAGNPASSKNSILDIKFNVGDSLVLTGSEDRIAKVIRVSNFKVLWSVTACDEEAHQTAAVESVGFCNTLPYIALGTTCGHFTIWDMNTKVKRTEKKVINSVVKIICDEFAPIVYLASTGKVLRAFDVRTGDLVKCWRGHKSTILDITISSDRSLLFTASDDHTCKIFGRGIFA